MSCWGRKTGSDDLKEEKLLEETALLIFLPQQFINVSFQSLPCLSQSLLTVSPALSHHSPSFFPSNSSMSPSSPPP
jgi:hypothetical protein